MKHNLVLVLVILTMLIIGTGNIITIVAQSLKYPSQLNQLSFNWTVHENIPIHESHENYSIANNTPNIEQREMLAQCEMTKLENSWDSSKTSSSCTHYANIIVEQREMLAQCEMTKLENSWDSSKTSSNCVD